MKRAWFVTGTDTGVGKTRVSSGLLRQATRQGLRTQAIKPVAAGCESTPDGWRNDDALHLMAAMSEPLRYETVNPVALPEALAPHIAAARAGQGLSLSALVRHCHPLLENEADITLIEGAGGWRVPLNERETLADLAIALQLPVILVVGLRLGCLNHALLTAEAIRRDGLRLAGWVANSLEPDLPALNAQIHTLQTRLAAPCLGRLPWQPNASLDDVAGSLQLP